jgi:hypothetical protein
MSSRIDYAAVTRVSRKHKSALTRAKNSGDPQKVIDACDKAFEDFDRYGYPDSWHTWNIAREDARFKLRMRA